MNKIKNNEYNLQFLMYMHYQSKFDNQKKSDDVKCFQITQHFHFTYQKVYEFQILNINILFKLISKFIKKYQ